jgi:hypothetical protein
VKTHVCLGGWGGAPLTPLGGPAMTFYGYLAPIV